MAIELTDQAQAAAEFAEQIDAASGFRAILNERKPVWDRLSEEQKNNWITNQTDPAIRLAYLIHEYLDEFFGGFKYRG